MEELIYAIRDGEKAHYLYGYPHDIQQEIIEAVEQEFKHDVKVIWSAASWHQIQSHKEKIKIVLCTDDIINTYRLGTPFQNMIRNGSIYLFFTDDEIKDQMARTHWFNFVKNLDDRTKYQYNPLFSPVIPRPEKTDKKEIKNLYRNTAAFLSNLLLVLLLFTYIAKKSMANLAIESFDIFALTFTALDIVNLFFGYHVYFLFKKQVNPFIRNQLQKTRFLTNSKLLKIIGRSMKRLFR